MLVKKLFKFYYKINKYSYNSKISYFQFILFIVLLLYNFKKFLNSASFIEYFLYYKFMNKVENWMKNTK